MINSHILVFFQLRICGSRFRELIRMKRFWVVNGRKPSRIDWFSFKHIPFEVVKRFACAESAAERGISDFSRLVYSGIGRDLSVVLLKIWSAWVFWAHWPNSSTPNCLKPLRCSLLIIFQQRVDHRTRTPSQNPSKCLKSVGERMNVEPPMP